MNFTLELIKKVLPNESDESIHLIKTKLNNRLIWTNEDDIPKIINLAIFILDESKRFEDEIQNLLLDKMLFTQGKFILSELIAISKYINLLKDLNDNQKLNQFAHKNKLFTYEDYLKENYEQLQKQWKIEFFDSYYDFLNK
ncbi:hypothetical protein V2P32_03505 [Mycoplasma sp. 06067-C1-B144P-99-0482-3]|uniref:Uncharacterized protein n=1 Tax=Mycoplasma capricolum subsp. capricolum TaxID=40479 RepID=A0A0C2ZLH9_MYCCA|nr:hypothetical protein [Mycoplasma capricolum]KIM13770.1 hypothetical protein MCGM508_01600 [Mycoplasma capricolum subsp. capricolum]